MAKEFTFDELNKSLSKHSMYGETMDKSTFSKIDEFIGTGNYMLNACLSGSVFGGIPNNRSVCFAGPSGTGKTFLLLNVVREAQAKGYQIIFYDSEAAVDSDMIEKFGIDPTKLRYEPCNTVQEFRSSISNLVKIISEQKRKGLDVPKVMVCLDSLGNLASQKEIDDALSGSDKADMTRAKTIKSLFRILGTQLAECKIPFVFTNHTYSGQSFIPIVTAGGGTGPEYFASIILFLRKAQLKEGQEKAGIVVTATPNKNRFAKPTPVKFIIHFDKGMNKYIGLEKYMSWENCGIAKGEIHNQKGYDKWKQKEKDSYDLEKFSWKDEDNKDWYFWPKETARKFVAKHCNSTIDVQQLFSNVGLPPLVLKSLDENVIKPEFSYGVNENVADELEAIIESNNDEE